MGFRFLLFPFQWVYLFILTIKKLFFALGIKKRHSFDLPVICVGNLCIGGSGKTPHTKYFANLLLRNKFDVAILLRGYKRSTKGFIHCNKKHTLKEIGDEAYEYVHSVNRKIKIFVCKQREKGIKRIINDFPETDVILMDDGFQHLKVKAGLNLLLTDYLNPFWKDFILPVGSLREHKSAKRRADIFIVSKAPKVFSPIIKRDIEEKINPANYQNIAYSYIKYGEPKLVYKDSEYEGDYPENIYSVFLLCGIANPYPLEEYLRRDAVEIIKYIYPDHHVYSESDIDRLLYDFNRHLMKKKVIITTEKDVARLMLPEIKEKLINLPLFYIPISIGIHDDKMFNLENKIIEYVRENRKDS